VISIAPSQTSDAVLPLLRGMHELFQAQLQDAVGRMIETKTIGRAGRLRYSVDTSGQEPDEDHSAGPFLHCFLLIPIDS
jgi:hypothetical protein